MNYLKSLFLIIIVSLLGGMLQHSIAHTNLAMLYILVVVITAARWGRGPSLMSAILSVLFFDFFFIPPQFSMTVADTQYLLAFATLFVVAIVISSLTLKEKELAKAAQMREAQTLALYNLSKDLIEADTMASLFKKAIDHTCDTFDAEAAIFIKDDHNLSLEAKSQKFSPDANDDLPKIKDIWRENRYPLLIPDRGRFYLSLKATKDTFGILEIHLKNKNTVLAPEQHRFLQAFANQIAITIEHFELAREAQQAHLLREAEKLHTAFLNSVSHDLRTPLVSISGSLSSIMDNPEIDEENKNNLIETAYEESFKLNQLVSDLLDMARVEAGALHLKKKPVDVKDLIGASLKQMEKTLKGFDIKINIGDDLPEIKIDFILMIKVLTNILDNAVKYSQDKKDIVIAAEKKGNDVEITIADRGLGILPSDLKQVFNKFYRVTRSKKHEGTGLGLSVCKGIVEAHNGKIWAENQKEGGTLIKINIPQQQ